MSEHRVTVVPHTHWDREWYQPFAVFRSRLVETVDQVLELLENDPDYTHFMLDGQAVVLEDYLEVRPEAEPRLAALVRSGRLAIGPWYTLADEFLSSPEALVRNLLLGRAVCSRFGEPMPVVYTPDSFGHVSLLPRLASGFGFDSLVFERGVGDEGEELGGEFCWRSPDGKSEVLAVHLLTTYSSAAGIGYGDWSRYYGFDPERAVAHARKALFGGTERIGMEGWLDESLDRIPGGSSAYAHGPDLLLLNGSDHLPPQADIPKAVALLDERIEEASFKLGRLRDYIDGVMANRERLPSYQGEFRGSRYHHILSGVFSARIYLKQANHEAQRELERYAEPLSALAHAGGAPYPQAILHAAWRDILRNHCHDSICGCSIDQVHEEMMPRFGGALASGRFLARKALAHLSRGFWQVAPAPLIEGRLSPPSINGVLSEEPAHLTAFNPHPALWQGVLEARLPIHAETEVSGMLTAQGEPVRAELERLEVEAPGDARVTEKQLLVRWPARLEPLSVTSFRLLAAGAGRRHGAPEPNGAPASQARPEEWLAGQVAPQQRNGEAGWRPAKRDLLPVRSGPDFLENGLVRLEVTGEALLLTHLDSGQVVRLRLALEDVADAGDEYDFSPLPGDEPIVRELHDLTASPPSPPGSEPGIRLSASMRCSGDLLLPGRLSARRLHRESICILPFELELRLVAGDPFVRVDLRVKNGSADHRLRLVVDSDVMSDRVAVEGHFDVLERPLTPPAADGWFQTPSGSEHQRRFLAVGDRERGLAVFNAGLPEYSASNGPDGVRLAITLLRCVGWLSRNDLISRPQGAGPALPTPAAQCPGEHRFRLGLMPFAGDWNEGQVPEAAERFDLQPLVEATSGLAEGAAWLEIPPGTLLSALKRAEAGDGLVVRLWNPGTRRVEGDLRLHRHPTSARLVDFDEQVRRELEPATRIPLSLDPKEIVSLHFSFGGEAVG